ncbi:MAG: hypothetical protein DRN96_03885 [Thermoproteota archaeon]|nr:MAG: hypothetical protein DRN96_03885 [Candidatus Korarchaeota archaeon]
MARGVAVNGGDLRKLSVHYYASRYPNAAKRLGVVYCRSVAEECIAVMKAIWSEAGKLVR